MKNIFKLLCALIMSFTMYNASAQLKLPAPSPAATAIGTVGLTEIKINYSAPGQKGRDLWGNVVAYNKPWRAGANGPTQISFDRDVKINGGDLKAGTYQVFITPRKNAKWTIHFSKGKDVFSYEKEDGTYDLDALKKDDVLAIEVNAETKPENFERLTYIISAEDNAVGKVSMRWGNTAVSFLVDVNASQNAMKSIDAALGSWMTYANAAEYYLNNNGDLNKANSWADQALALNDHFFAHWVKARILYENGNKAEAKTHALKAKQLGEEKPSGFYNSRKADIEAFLTKL